MTTEPALRVLSLGAGVQSTALAVMSAVGDLPKVDAAIFADTGWEPRAVYEHLDRLDAEVLAPAGIPLHRVSQGNIRADALDPEHRFASMPMFVRNPDGKKGMVRRQCTNEYKLKPIKRQVRQLLGYPHPRRVPRGMYVEQWVGISRDEFMRAKSSDVKYARNRFPLLELDMTRDDCAALLDAHGFGSTAKSACIGCPFHGNRQWRELRDTRPDEWADAVAFDEAIRNGTARANAQGHTLRGQMYLHASLLPLAQAPIDRERRRRGDALAERENNDSSCGPFSCRGGDLDMQLATV